MQELLRACGRAHSLADVHAAVAAMRDVAPPTWSLDVISGLPGLTLDKWQHTLESAVAAAPPHISVYDLQVRRPGLPDLCSRHVPTCRGCSYLDLSVTNTNACKQQTRSGHLLVYIG